MSENDLRKLRIGTRARVHVIGNLSAFDGELAAISPETSAVESGIMDEQKYIGLHAPHFYIADVNVANPLGALRAGMVGEAKVFVKRRSLAGMTGESILDFFLRKVW